jgi:hypothetical protein
MSLYNLRCTQSVYSGLYGYWSFYNLPTVKTVGYFYLVYNNRGQPQGLPL